MKKRLPRDKGRIKEWTQTKRQEDKKNVHSDKTHKQKPTDTTIDRNTQVYYINRDRDIEEIQIGRGTRDRNRKGDSDTHTHMHEEKLTCKDRNTCRHPERYRQHTHVMIKLKQVHSGRATLRSKLVLFSIVHSLCMPGPQSHLSHWNRQG